MITKLHVLFTTYLLRAKLVYSKAYNIPAPRENVIYRNPHLVRRGKRVDSAERECRSLSRSKHGPLSVFLRAFFAARRQHLPDYQGTETHFTDTI